MSVEPATIVIFIAIIALTLGITAWASRRNKDTNQHYAAGGTISGWQNALAVVADLISAATFLGVLGLVALNGIFGFYLLGATMIAFLCVLLLVVEPLRNLGKFTIADALMSRFNVKGVRVLMAVNTVIITIFYMITQLVGAGVIIGLLLGLDYALAVIVIGVLMGIYVMAGGMLATTWIQIVKSVIILGAILAMLMFMLARFSFNPLTLFDEVTAQVGSDMFTTPLGTTIGGLDTMSTYVAQIIGTAALPHIWIRFFTVPNAKEARTSIVGAIWILGLVFLAITLLGYGAAVLVGQDVITNADAGGNLAALQLAELLGGPILLAVIAAAVFGAILSTVSGLVITASGALAHDLYNHTIRNGEASEQEQMRAARLVPVVISAIAILLAFGAQGFNLALLTLLAATIAASVNIPVLLLTLSWKGFNASGAIIGMLTGLVASLGLVLVGPSVMGENALSPLANPALVSVPVAFLGCYLGTLLGKSRAQEERKQGVEIPYEKIQVRLNTGIGDIEKEPKKEAVS